MVVDIVFLIEELIAPTSNLFNIFSINAFDVFNLISLSPRYAFSLSYNANKSKSFVPLKLANISKYLSSISTLIELSKTKPFVMLFFKDKSNDNEFVLKYSLLRL